MALFARMNKQTAEALVMETWPQHSWHKRSLWWLLNQNVNKKNIPNIPLNDKLLESVKRNGFVSPFLVIDTWYPICGGQRLRVASEMPEKWLKKTEVDVCRLDRPVWKQLHHWHNQEEAHKVCQVFFQMYEVVFKSLYMEERDPQGVPLLHYEEYGNQLHWPQRDGSKPAVTTQQIAAPAGPPSKKKMVLPVKF